MNWEAIGAIGEIVGAIAVLVTLIFLILQIQQNTIALQQQSSRESTSSLQQIKSILPNNSSRNYSNDYGKSYGNSIAYVDHFDTNDGGMIRVWCSVWDVNNQIVKNNLWKNTLDIGISSKELRYFIDNEAY